MESLTVSQIAKRGGINLQTVRYCERSELFTPTSRTRSRLWDLSPEARWIYM